MKIDYEKLAQLLFTREEAQSWLILYETFRAAGRSERATKAILRAFKNDGMDMNRTGNAKKP